MPRGRVKERAKEEVICTPAGGLTRMVDGEYIFHEPKWSEPPWTPKLSQAEHARIHAKYDKKRKALIARAVKGLEAKFGPDSSRWPRSGGQKSPSVSVYSDGEVRRIA